MELAMTDDHPALDQPAPADLAQAQAFTRRLASSHYENFSVVTFLLPRRLRQDFCNVYAFCRMADDAADEVGDTNKSLELLAELKDQTRACFAGRASSPLFIALRDTATRHELETEPFLDLIDAFEQDQRVSRYDTFEQLLDYCRRSADPVGRIVLALCGYRDQRRRELSDQTCSALQLVNFWQDVKRDAAENDRIYLPRDSMVQFAVAEEQILAGRCDDNFRQLIRFEVDRAEKMFDAGAQLLPTLDRAFRRQISLFGKGGRAIIAAIRRQNYDTLTRRPSLSNLAKFRLALGALLGTDGESR
jgi:squalene synthase HpnC